MWTCPKCSEDVDDDFDVCWNCGTDREGNPAPEFDSADTATGAPNTAEDWQLARLRASTGADPDARPVDPSGAVRQKQRRRIPLGCLFFVVVVVVVAFILVRGCIYVREAARQSCCQGRLNQLQLAFRHYHEVYDCFPPAYVPDARGRPMHSWRVLILPFLDHREVYEQYNFNEPWNGPNNRLLADRIYADTFHCESGPHTDNSPITDYVVIVGDETTFPGSKSISLDDMSDGPENTILLVELRNSDIHWMEPRDLKAEEMSFAVNDPATPSISGPHPAGPAVVFADHITAFRLDASLQPETVRALTTPAGGEQVTKRQLARWHEWTGAYLAE